MCGPLKFTLNDGVEPITCNLPNLDNDPIIVLPCQHYFTTSFLDAMLTIDAVYVRDESGQFVQGMTSGELTVQSKQCPKCRMLISCVHRYNRILKRDIIQNHIAQNSSFQ